MEWDLADYKERVRSIFPEYGSDGCSLRNEIGDEHEHKHSSLDLRGPVILQFGQTPRRFHACNVRLRCQHFFWCDRPRSRFRRYKSCDVTLRKVPSTLELH